MSAHCCHPPKPAASMEYRRVLWVALFVNAAMFIVEILSGLFAGSASLQADALDFFSDAANYGISLFVLGMPLSRRARAALLKGASMALFAALVIWTCVHNALLAQTPHAFTMGAVGVIALAANVTVALLLFRFRDGDANMQSVWLCTRNDAIGNLAVVAAAAGVFGTGSYWPDIIVAAIMAGLALTSANTIVRTAIVELAHARGFGLTV